MYQILLQLPIGFIIALSGALVPGPLLAYVVAKSASHGGKTGPLAILGHFVVEICLLSLLLLGLGVVLRTQEFQVAVGIIGGACLLPLGALTIRGVVKRGKSGPPILRYPPLLGGILYSSIFNPTVIIWWATIGFATLMDAYATTLLAGVLFWLIGHWGADFAWFSFISISVARGREILGSRGYKILLILCGAALLIIGIHLLGKYLGKLI